MIDYIHPPPRDPSHHSHGIDSMGLAYGHLGILPGAADKGIRGARAQEIVSAVAGGYPL